MATFIEQQRQELVHHLSRHLQGEVRFDSTSRKLYSTDASIYQVEPLGVVLPRTVADVVATVQIAGEMRVPLTARGGGTSLSGQSIGPGIVLDCSKYLHRILDLDPTRRVARIEPGVVLDVLNREAGAHDLQFGPDVSTSSRANLGGMMGNNSAGARSIVYGKTIDHVVSQVAVLADGATVQAGPLDEQEWKLRSQRPGIEGAAYRTLTEVVREQHDEIHRRFPRILRRVSGYNLDRFAGVPVPVPPEGLRQQPGLHHLLVGSEGSLGVVVEAEVNLVRRPVARGLLVPQFATMADAMNALAACLEMSPSAVEVLDHILLDLTAGNLALRETTRPIDRRARAIFMVEFSSDDPAEVADRVEKLQRRLQGCPGLVMSVPAIDPAIRDPLWNLRRASMPLLYSMTGDAKPITFIEDPAVSPEQLPAFVAAFKEILQRHGTEGSFYGHASVGCLHIRPVMNLKDPVHVARMRQIMEEVTDLVLLHGGSLSGEHGDGYARSEWNRKMFGPTLYEAFCRVKGAFDPHNLLNPGRVVHGPRMTDHLRYPPDYRPAEPATVFDYSRQEGFLRSVEMCNGSGACRKLSGGTMCPSFRATLDERDSTRGRANALRHALAGAGPLAQPETVPLALRQRWLHEVFDLCLMCKGCKAECPSNVDVGKLKAEFLQFYYHGRVRPLEHLLVAGIPWFNRLAAPLAPVVNWVQTRRVSRWLLEKVAGIDRRRSLPLLHRDHFRSWMRKHRPDPRAGTAGKVLLLADCFTTYNEPWIGEASVRVLEAAGYSVELADLFCCGRVWISKGFLRLARARVQSQVRALAAAVADGTPILGLEPSCLLTLVDEWPELVPGPQVKTVAAASHLADSWLAAQVKAGHCQLPLAPSTDSCVLHGHCHQKALHGVGASAPALRLIPGMQVQTLDAGCCGMAGAFGFSQEHFPLSVQIANLALLPALEQSPEKTVVAPGTSCRHQIHDLAGRRALHPLEVLARHLQLPESPSPEVP
ncbi:MAG: FAD-linked oxidase C-terminal domain-containing protein [Gemmataceae bacterium]